MGFSVSHQSAGNNCRKLVKRKKLVFCRIESKHRERERERIGDWLEEFCERRKSETLRKANGRVQGVLWLRAWDTVGGSSTGRRRPKARGWQGFLAWIWILTFHVHESCVSRKTLLRLEVVPASKEGRKKERKKPLLESFLGGLQGGVDLLFSTLCKARVLACCSQRQASQFLFLY